MWSWRYLSYSSLKNRRPLRLQREESRPNKNQERRKAGERGRAWREPLCLCSHSHTVFLVSLSFPIFKVATEGKKGDPEPSSRLRNTGQQPHYSFVYLENIGVQVGSQLLENILEICCVLGFHLFEPQIESFLLKFIRNLRLDLFFHDSCKKEDL